MFRSVLFSHLLTVSDNFSEVFVLRKSKNISVQNFRIDFETFISSETKQISDQDTTTEFPLRDYTMGKSQLIGKPNASMTDHRQKQ
jgi:hypothetical protein